MRTDQDDHALNTNQIGAISNFTKFTKSFCKQKYRAPEHCMKMKDMHRILKLQRHIALLPGSYPLEAMKLNDCARAIEGFREFLFALASSALEWIEKKTESQNYQFYNTLEGIHATRSLNRAHSPRASMHDQPS